MPIYLTDSPSLYNLLYSPIQPLLLRKQRSGISRRLCIPPYLAHIKADVASERSLFYLYPSSHPVHVLLHYTILPEPTTPIVK